MLVGFAREPMSQTSRIDGTPLEQACHVVLEKTIALAQVSHGYESDNYRLKEKPAVATEGGWVTPAKLWGA
jgi:hypothetical protein